MLLHTRQGFRCDALSRFSRVHPLIAQPLHSRRSPFRYWPCPLRAEIKVAFSVGVRLDNSWEAAAISNSASFSKSATIASRPDGSCRLGHPPVTHQVTP